MSVIWHDVECGSYRADVPLWRSLARAHGDPVLEVGAGTGRIALDLARQGHRVRALDRDPELIAELARRAEGLPVSTTVADARAFELGIRFPLILVPMQTIQLLGGRDRRLRFLACARSHLDAGGEIAIAISEMLELYETDRSSPAALPDVRELDGVLYSSLPTAVRAQRNGFLLERRRETVTDDGRHTVERDVVQLDRLTVAELEQEARSAGLEPVGHEEVAATADHVGSVVVLLRA